VKLLFLLSVNLSKLSFLFIHDAFLERAPTEPFFVASIFLCLLVLLAAFLSQGLLPFSNLNW
jgi:hypothetical protein